MDHRFRSIVCLLAVAGSISTALADPPLEPAAPTAPTAPGATDATARAEAKVKDLEAEAQKARLEVGRALADSKYDPTVPAVKAAMAKASEVERRLQSAQDDWDRLRGDRRFLIEEAQRECVAKAEEVAGAVQAVLETRMRRLPAAEIAAAEARVVAARTALKASQEKLVALPLPTEPATRPDYFERRIAQAAHRAEVLTSGVKSASDAATAIEETGDAALIGLAYERLSQMSAQASAARDELARVRSLVDAARPPPPPRPAEPAGGGGPTVQPPR